MNTRVVFASRGVGLGLIAALVLSACARNDNMAAAPSPEQPVQTASAATAGDYVIGPLDTLSIFVWRNPELSTSAPVRPDGYISIPLVQDIEAAGRTPAQLASELETALSEYIQAPTVTVMVNDFVGPFQRQVRVVGEAAQPQALAFREGMSLLDLMIGVGGLTPFASGNRAVLVRQTAQGEERVRVRLDDLLQEGDMSANVRLRPGDVLIVPQSWF